jgi:photosystem II stability/assembly factor-like uncharacterized protein
MQIHIIAFLLFFQSFAACQQDQGNALPLAASIGLPSTASCQQGTEKARPTAANIIFQSTDGGQTWQDVSAGLPVDFGVGRIFADGGEVFLASESGLYHSSSATLVPKWEKEFFLNEKITDVFPGSAGPYASSYEIGFFQEMPGTDIWNPMHNALKDKRVRTILETSNGNIFVGCESGIFKSTDGGITWKHVFKEGVNSFAASGDVLICGGYRGMLRSTDGGEHWDCVLSGAGGAYNTKLIGDRFVTITDGEESWGEVSSDGMMNRLYASADNGKTWQRMDEGISQIRLLDEMLDVTPPTRVINDIEQAGEYLFCSLNAGIFRSSDWGKTWELVRPSNGKKMISLAVSGQVIYAVVVVGC